MESLAGSGMIVLRAGALSVFATSNAELFGFRQKVTARGECLFTSMQLPDGSNLKLHKAGREKKGAKEKKSETQNVASAGRSIFRSGADRHVTWRPPIYVKPRGIRCTVSRVYSASQGHFQDVGRF